MLGVIHWIGGLAMVTLVILPPTARLAEVADAAERIEERLRADEAQARLEPTPPTDPGLVGPMHRWVRGASLRRTLEGADLAAGDFVRWAKQTIDLLDQLSLVAEGELGRTARRALDAVRRGIVAYSSV